MARKRQKPEEVAAKLGHAVVCEGTSRSGVPDRSETAIFYL